MMTKEQVLKNWRYSDDTRLADALGVRRQTIQYWRTKGAGKSKYETQILEWADRVFKADGRLENKSQASQN